MRRKDESKKPIIADFMSRYYGAAGDKVLYKGK